ncbi:hypothetical protein EVAR_99509_1 [Eumeta japonica]|uniref:Uncharacterized protein n=1 Tax=Eumeta variegata TaxID=151549 RepID=A0A4C2AAD3_EUMVA|nr:hypothetical protein EVAR_99509_1 [Eumeta japonica]
MGVRERGTGTTEKSYFPTIAVDPGRVWIYSVVLSTFIQKVCLDFKPYTQTQGGLGGSANGCCHLYRCYNLDRLLDVIYEERSEWVALDLNSNLIVNI